MGIASMTCLGNPDEELIDGKSTGDKKRDALIRACSKDCYETFFKGKKGRGIDLGYVDAGENERMVISIGIEPAYMYWPLKIIKIRRDKHFSSFITGYSWEPYGSGLRLTERQYLDYKRSSKFIRFIDKWHPKLYGTH